MGTGPPRKNWPASGRRGSRRATGIAQEILCHNSVVLSPKRKTIMALAGGLLLSFLLVIAFSPHFLDSHHGMRQNESAAVGSLRKIHDLQSAYASAHPDKGFARQLQQLRSAENTTTTYDPTTALLSGEWSGYKFILLGCTPAENGIVVRYQITAIPTARGLTGMHAFCTDQSGQIFYDASGSATGCLVSRLPLF